MPKYRTYFDEKLPNLYVADLPLASALCINSSVLFLFLIEETIIGLELGPDQAWPNPNILLTIGKQGADLALTQVLLDPTQFPDPAQPGSKFFDQNPSQHLNSILSHLSNLENLC